MLQHDCHDIYFTDLLHATSPRLRPYFTKLTAHRNGVYTFKGSKHPKRMAHITTQLLDGRMWVSSCIQTDSAPDVNSPAPRPSAYSAWLVVFLRYPEGGPGGKGNRIEATHGVFGTCDGAQLPNAAFRWKTKYDEEGDRVVPCPSKSPYKNVGLTSFLVSNCAHRHIQRYLSDPAAAEEEDLPSPGPAGNLNVASLPPPPPAAAPSHAPRQQQQAWGLGVFFKAMSGGDGSIVVKREGPSSPSEVKEADEERGSKK